MAIVRTYPDGRTHINGVDLKRLGSHSKITALLDELGFSCHKSTGGVALDTRALSLFVKKLNEEYGITSKPIEDEVTIFSLYEPWLMEFLNKCISVRHFREVSICD